MDYPDVRGALPREPSRKSVRWHAFLVSTEWAAIGCAVVIEKPDIHWAILAIPAAASVAAFLLHIGSKSVDLNGWVKAAVEIIKDRRS